MAKHDDEVSRVSVRLSRKMDMNALGSDRNLWVAEDMTLRKDLWNNLVHALEAAALYHTEQKAKWLRS